MSLLPGMPDVKLPSSVGGLDISWLYGSDAKQENATAKAVAENLARSRFERPGGDKRDSITGERAPTVAEKLSDFFGVASFEDVKSQANQLGNQREATQAIQQYKDDHKLDFSTLSEEDRKDPEKVRVFATKELAKRGFADKGITATGDTLAEVNKSGKVGEQQLADEVLKGSLRWTTERQDLADSIARENAKSDRNFGLQLQTLTSQNEQALATLQASIEQAKMQNEQATLDREYLDRRDLRDYNYQIKKDDQDQLDKIFGLILGGIDKMF